ncbi:MAG TPA: SPOR domain-containing protein [Candidatus Acidoferrum sp.]|nr:SPOR domain-containing protein [Candidatus Acidoferrum sp.]
MSYGGHRGAGERVLEGRHVIGLFLALILLSGLFFTLGYVMGLHQSEASADALPGKPESRNPSKPEAASKRASKTPPAEPATETAAPADPEWEFYHAGEKAKTEDRLKPVPSTSSPQLRQSTPVLVKSSPASRNASNNASKSSNSVTTPSGAYSLQVAAMNKEVDALDLAKVLQKKKFPAYVLSPHGDRYYRVQVGPYADLKAADIARRGLEDAGFKAFVKR